MVKKQSEEKILETMKEMQDDETEDAAEDNADLQQAIIEEYGSPDPDVEKSAQAYLHRSSFEAVDTLRTTFLHQGELGKPLFTVRFLLDMEDIANFYIDPLVKELNDQMRKAKQEEDDEDEEEISNKISNYFWEKIQNITSSGMSNEGFGPNLSITKKIDMSRKKFKGNLDNLRQNQSNRTRT